MKEYICGDSDGLVRDNKEPEIKMAGNEVTKPPRSKLKTALMVLGAVVGAWGAYHIGPVLSSAAVVLLAGFSSFANDIMAARNGNLDSERVKRNQRRSKNVMLSGLFLILSVSSVQSNYQQKSKEIQKEAEATMLQQFANGENEATYARMTKDWEMTRWYPHEKAISGRAEVTGQTGRLLSVRVSGDVSPELLGNRDFVIGVDGMLRPAAGKGIPTTRKATL